MDRLSGLPTGQSDSNECTIIILDFNPWTNDHPTGVFYQSADSSPAFAVGMADQNADLIHLLNTSTAGSVNNLNGESVDRDVLSNLSAQLAILSNILAQSHATNQEIPDDLADDST